MSLPPTRSNDGRSDVIAVARGRLPLRGNRRVGWSHPPDVAVELAAGAARPLAAVLKSLGWNYYRETPACWRRAVA